MGEKRKFKTHLQNTFWFFEPVFARLASKFEKVLIWPIKKIRWKNCKNAPKKSYKQNKFDEHE